MHSNISLPVGKYLVTPLSSQTDTGDYAASVSIRRGMHDRVVRFQPLFASDALALCYAAAEGRRMALQNQMA